MTGWFKRTRGAASRSPNSRFIDTGIFDDDRYFDVDIEYAKAGAEDILLRLTVTIAGPKRQRSMYCLRSGSGITGAGSPTGQKPSSGAGRERRFVAEHGKLGLYAIHFDGPDEIKFCENETNVASLYGSEDTGRLYKDGFHDYVVKGNQNAVGSRKGTKGGRHLPAEPSTRRQHDDPGEAQRRPAKIGTLCGFRADLRVCVSPRRMPSMPSCRRKISDEDLRRIQRQAFAGILWSKQYFYYDVTEWLEGDPAQPKPPKSRLVGRNSEWVHANMEDVVSMPDKWEFPWFAAWDWAFHVTTLAYLDLENAKHQLILLCQPWYMHPNGQLPAYEWNFSDVNPPVQAWAALYLYDAERRQKGRGDRKFLETVFTKLLLNFTWWVNRKDPHGRKCLPGRLSRPGQYRRLRSILAAAGRRHAGAVGRNLAGWRCTASTCCGSPSSWRRKTTSIRTSRPSSSNIS